MLDTCTNSVNTNVPFPRRFLKTFVKDRNKLCLLGPNNAYASQGTSQARVMMTVQKPYNLFTQIAPEFLGCPNSESFIINTVTFCIQKKFTGEYAQADLVLTKTRPAL